MKQSGVRGTPEAGNVLSLLGYVLNFDLMVERRRILVYSQCWLMKLLVFLLQDGLQDNALLSSQLLHFRVTLERHRMRKVLR